MVFTGLDEAGEAKAEAEGAAGKEPCEWSGGAGECGGSICSFLESTAVSKGSTSLDRLEFAVKAGLGLLEVR